MFCIHCGKENSEESSFCAFCGKPIKGEGISDEIKSEKTFSPKNKKRNNLMIICSFIVVVILVLIYLIFIRETPQSIANKILDMRYNIEKRINEKKLSELKELRNNFYSKGFKSRKQAKQSLYEVENIAPYFEGNEYSIAELPNRRKIVYQELNDYQSKILERYKNDQNTLAEIQNYLSPQAMLNNTQRLEPLLNEIESLDAEMVKTINNMKPPLPTIENIKNDIPERVNFFSQRLNRWSSIMVNKNSEFLTIMGRPDTTNIMYKPGRELYNKLYYFVNLAGYAVDLIYKLDLSNNENIPDKWVIDWQNTKVLDGD